MPYRATLGSETFHFDSLATLLAKATPLRSGDELAGVAADSAAQRVAARLALADLPASLALRAALGGELAGVQPLQGPAGLGTYEAGVWLASGAQAGEQARVVAAALAVHAFSLAVALGAAALAQLIPAPLHQSLASLERKSAP